MCNLTLNLFLDKTSLVFLKYSYLNEKELLVVNECV
jgi:hypothetical protein